MDTLAGRLAINFVTNKLANKLIIVSKGDIKISIVPSPVLDGHLMVTDISTDSRTQMELFDLIRDGELPATIWNDVDYIQAHGNNEGGNIYNFVTNMLEGK